MSAPADTSINDLDNLCHLIEVARGERPADLLLTGGKVVNVFSKEVYKTNVAIYKNQIAGVGDYYISGSKVLDLNGFFVIPGLIDAHMHMESSMLSPAEYARAVLPHGTTSIICDPHEIANVLGIHGIKYLLESSRNIPLNIFVTASSCVPATHLETSGAILSASEIESILKLEGVIGLAEMMNFPGVINGRREELEKLLISKRMKHPVDGHAPSLTGKDLNAYISAGINTDHEIRSKEEALEKLRLGMYVMIREGSAARNLDALFPLVNSGNSDRFMFVSDDMHPQDLIRYGHMDYILKKGIQLGIEPVTAISMATINPARAYKLDGIGGIAPGYFADLVAVNNLVELKVHAVIKDGRVVVLNRTIVVDVPHVEDKSVKNTMMVKKITSERFKIRIKGNKVRVIELIPEQIYTRHLIEGVTKDIDGEVKADPSRDLAKIAVIERHRATGNIGLGFVRGFSLKHGAIGSSVAHDSHNIIIVGTNDRDMYLTAQKIIELGGGHVVVSHGKVLGSLALPIAGLLSDSKLEDLVMEEEKLLDGVKSLGVKLQSPFFKLSFLSLPVIPELKITDLGLVDVSKFDTVDLEP